MTLRKIIVLAIGIGIVGLGILLQSILASQKAPIPKKSPVETHIYVSTVPVSYSEVETELRYFGRVQSLSSVALISEAQGKILEGKASLKAGQRVRKGDLVFRIADKEARLALQSQRSQFMKSIADVLADLQVDFPDRFPVWQGYFESIDVAGKLPQLPAITEQKEKTFLSTRGIQSSYYSILSAEERLWKYRVYAPFSGTLSEVKLEPGSVANPGTLVAVLSRTDQLELVLPVLTKDLRWLQVGAPVEVRSPSGAGSWSGKVVRISDQVDARTQSVNVYVRIQTGEARSVLDGQYLEAVLAGKVVREAMEVPRKALVDQESVFLVEGGQLKRKQVVVHKVNPNSVVLSGLVPGSQLVTERPLSATEGLEVKILDPS